MCIANHCNVTTYETSSHRNKHPRPIAAMVRIAKPQQCWGHLILMPKLSQITFFIFSWSWESFSGPFVIFVPVLSKLFFPESFHILWAKLTTLNRTDPVTSSRNTTPRVFNFRIRILQVLNRNTFVNQNMAMQNPLFISFHNGSSH